MLTELDHLRLTNLLNREGSQHKLSPAARELADILDLSEVVAASDIAADVITMRSLVRIEDASSGAQRTLTLAYPEDEWSQGVDPVSVLSPLGANLLGARVGHLPSWHGPTGEVHRAKVLAVLYQPEASGDRRL